MRRQPEELRAISEALLYELQMLFGTAQALRDDIQGTAEEAMSWPQRMACIESFAIHARTLDAFVWGKPVRRFPDDVLAVDFFDDGVWESVRTRIQRSALDDLRLRAGYEIAHLRTTRGGTSLEVRCGRRRDWQRVQALSRERRT